VNRTLLARMGAELAGTGVLVAVGTGAVVRAARVGGIPQWEMAIAWFLAVLVPIVLFVRVSGAHLNPVVTLALTASRRVAAAEAPAYIVAQFAGAFVGSALVWATLGNGAALGATVPMTGNLVLVAGSEAGFTAVLVASVFTLSDLGAGPGRARLTLPALAVGLSTYVIGPWTGSSLNPARSLAPAVLSGTYTDLWVYVVAVVLGGLLVAWAWKPRAVDRLDRGPGRENVAQ
jgi:glycerol uptake facilitator-like aquaporin